ncbi:MAG TPA: carboxypeptidase-like regulatory domain-containing protein [Thermoanaerobaculia bacterium]|nr:carboxypeptidase-like regulatory domain-containing protein [Thermoanaerobaculia bacterium]
MKNRSRKPSLLRSPWVWTLLWVLLAAAPLAAARFAQGERVQLTGVVTDPQGRPLSDVRVSFEATRTYFSMRHLQRTQTEEVRRVTAATDASGQYTIAWPWDSYFNHFELAVGVPVRKARKESLVELAREDVTKRLQGGSPVVVSLVVQAKNAEFVGKLREFVASVRSDDEHKVYDEMGRPDKVERVQYPGRTEVSWWYFDAGRVYRFKDGRLEQVVPFEPVKS